MTWFAEADVAYYVLVHGNSSEAGTFGLNVSSPVDLPVLLPMTTFPPCVNITFSLTLNPFSTETTVVLSDLVTGQVYWDDEILERPNFFDPNLPLVYNLVECVDPASCYRFEINHPLGNSVPDPEAAEFALLYDSTVVHSGAIGIAGSFRIFYVGALCYQDTTDTRP